MCEPVFGHWHVDSRYRESILIHFHTTRCMSWWEPPTLGITLCTCKASMKDRRQKIRRELKAQRELKAKAASVMLACNHMLQDMEDMISSPWFSYVSCVRVHASHASVYQIDGNIWTNFEQIWATSSSLVGLKLIKHLKPHKIFETQQFCGLGAVARETSTPSASTWRELTAWGRSESQAVSRLRSVRSCKQSVKLMSNCSYCRTVSGTVSDFQTVSNCLKFWHVLTCIWSSSQEL